ncbi:hypothetical protein PIB30_063133 [Stylosanthes scabra]|uniref:Phosphotransferase n=1 Tax=Stylosanthes scabra TaxID=79078 RepID=A0ABU6ZK06_9FABA|nr:hypothetical protein [Stylosanthes scabra]
MRNQVVVGVAVGTTVVAVAIGALIWRWKLMKEQQLKHARNIIRKFARECATPVAKLWQVADDLVSQMKASLDSPSSNETSSSSTLNMIISNVTALPNGDEEGFFYGVNVHGTNVLILCARLGGKNKPICDLQREEIPIPPHVLAGSSMVRKGLMKDLNQALKNLGTKMHIFALVDETIGGLAGGRYYNRDSVAAITLAMRTNAAYTEPSEDPYSTEMVISMEWGNFRSPHLPLTSFDTRLDSESTNPGSGIFEKLISGMYLGEIARLVLLKLAQETGLFGSKVPPNLMTAYALSSPDMAAMHQDTSEDREIVGEMLNDIFGIDNSSLLARELVAEVCDIVTERGARLAGAGIIGIIKKLDRIENRKSVVTVEGGLYEHYRIFRNYLHSSVWQMLGKDFSDNVIVEHSHGGTGTGALFLAAAHTHKPLSSDSL